MNVAALAPVRKLTRREYDRLVEMGWFKEERVELIDGLLVAMSPQGARHAEAVSRLVQLLVPRLVGRALVRVQSPLGIGEDAEPEPDLAVVPLQDYSQGHPEVAHLVIEVADSSITTDRILRSELYARGLIPEYWLVDLGKRVVEIYGDPGNGVYASVTRVTEEGTLTSRAFPDVTVAVREILPTR